MDKKDWETFKDLIQTKEGKERFLQLNKNFLRQLGIADISEIDKEISEFIKTTENNY